MEKKSQHMMKGMQKDMDPVYNTEGTYPFALNAVLGSRDGNNGAIVNEEGNELCFSEPEGVIQIGSTALPDGSTVLFSTDNTYGYIYLQDSCKCNIKLLIKSSCLNFRTYHQIDALSRVIRGCENIIYFTDNFNPYRSINIDKLDIYLASGFTSVQDANANPDNGWNCTKFNHFPSYNFPVINIENIYNSGGKIKTGAYQFTIRYLDINLNPTNWIIITNPVTIIEDSYSTSYESIAGSEPYSQQDDNYTNKSVGLNLSQLDTDYKYYQIGIIESSFGNGQPTINYKSDRQLITGSTSNFIFSGFNEQEYELTSLGEFNIDSLYLNTVEAHVQIDDRLLLANTTSYEYDWATLQRCTLLTKVFWDKRILENEQLEGTSIKDTSKYATVTFDDRTFIADEVYSFGLMLVFKNGIKSPVFHIPGRKANFDYDNNDITAVANANPTVIDLNSGHYRGTGVANEWDTKLLTVVPDGFFTDPLTQIGVSCVEHIPEFEFINCTQSNPITTTIKHVPTSVTGNILSFTLASDENLKVRIMFNNNTDVIYNLDSVNNSIDLNGLTPITFLFWLSTNNGQTAYVESTSSDPLITFAAPSSGVVFRPSSFNHIGCQIERWKVYNTGCFTTNGNLLGYHQNSNSFYNPNIVDCNGISIWDATMFGGDNLSNSNIRHHRIPDLSMKGRMNGDTDKHQVLTGTTLYFDLTDVYANIPQEIKDELQGYFIVTGNRDILNKTVLDKGYFASNVLNNQLQASRHLLWSDRQLEASPYSTVGTIASVTALNSTFVSNDEPYSYSQYISNNFIYNSDIVDAGYVKVEFYKRANIRNVTTLNSATKAYKSNDFREGVGLPSGLGYSYGFYTFDQGPMREIKTSFIVPYGIDTAPVSQFGINFVATNGAGGQPYGVIVTKRKLQPGTQDQDEDVYPKMTYGSIKVYRDVYINLNNIKYYSTHNNIFTFNSSGSTIAIVQEGDTFITSTRNVLTFGERTGSDNNTGVTAIVNEGVFMIESDINSSLRHASATNDRFYPKHFTENDYFHIFGKYNLTLQNVTNADDIFTYGQFIYTYNFDYSKRNIEKIYFPLDETYDYCNKCRTREPFNIYYSEKATIEDRNDNYKIILASNYTTIPGDAGDITNLFKEKDQLYVHTERALWAFKTRPQEIDTNEDNIYIGTGSFLSIPPQRLVSVDHGYAGSKDKFATVGTQFGTFFIDSIVGKVFLFSSGLDEISLKGMERWFFDNLPLKFDNEFYIKTGIKYNIRHTADKNAVGYIASYDPLYNRLLLTKKDYKFANNSYGGILNLNNPNPSTSLVYYDIDEEQYIKWYYYNDITEQYIETDLMNKTYFENHSFTISYDFQIGAWVSFHSYIPTYMYSDRTYLYTSSLSRSGLILTSSTWKHGLRGNYTTFYNTPYPYILELIINHDGPIEKYFNVIQYNQNAFVYLNDEQLFTEIENRTFNKFYVYNNYQISGERDLQIKFPTLYADVTYPLNVSIVDRTDNFWRINRFRDIAVQRQNANFSLTTSNWSLRNSYYNNIGQGFIDKVVNTNAIDVNKSLYTQGRFKDKYMVARLMFFPVSGVTQNTKLVTQLLTTTVKQSLR